MTPDDFRGLALTLAGTVEQAHMRHPDFRVGKKIFATLGYPDGEWAMVKLTTEQQAILLQAEPDIFVPAAGAWGRKGSTLARLARLDDPTARSALQMAWKNVGL